MEKQYKAFTFCDFGQVGRKDLLSRHYTYASAMRQYRRIWDIYHRLHGYRVWVEESKYVDDPTLGRKE